MDPVPVRLRKAILQTIEPDSGRRTDLSQQRPFPWRLQFSTAVNARLFLIVGAPRVTGDIEQPGRQWVGSFAVLPDKRPGFQTRSGEQRQQSRFVKSIHVPPRGIHPPTLSTGRSADSRILAERDADNDFMAGYTDNLTARLFHLGNMLQYFGAKNAIKRVVGKLQARGVTGNGNNTWDLKSRLAEVQSGNLGKGFGEDPGEKAVSGSNIENRSAASGKKPHQICCSGPLVNAGPIRFVIAHRVYSMANREFWAPVIRYITPGTARPGSRTQRCSVGSLRVAWIG